MLAVIPRGEAVGAKENLDQNEEEEGDATAASILELLVGGSQDTFIDKSFFAAPNVEDDEEEEGALAFTWVFALNCASNSGFPSCCGAAATFADS